MKKTLLGLAIGFIGALPILTVYRILFEMNMTLAFIFVAVVLAVATLIYILIEAHLNIEHDSEDEK